MHVPWSRKIPRVSGQLNQCITTTEPGCWSYCSPCTLESMLHKKRSHHDEKPMHHNSGADPTHCHWRKPTDSKEDLCVHAKLLQLCPTLCDPLDCSPPGSSVHGESLGRNTGVGYHSLLQGIFPTQGQNPGLLHSRQILYCQGRWGSPVSSYISSNQYSAKVSKWTLCRALEPFLYASLFLWYFTLWTLAALGFPNSQIYLLNTTYLGLLSLFFA